MNRYRLLIATGLPWLAVFSAGTVLRAAIHRSVDPGKIIATIRMAKGQFSGHGSAPVCRTIKDLVATLTEDNTPYNRWILRHLNSALQALDAGAVTDGQRQLDELLLRLTVPLNPYDLRSRLEEFATLVEAGTPAAAARCELGVRAYARELVDDYSPTSLWAQIRFGDILSAFASQNLNQVDTILKEMLATIQ